MILEMLFIYLGFIILEIIYQVMSLYDGFVYKEIEENIPDVSVGTLISDFNQRIEL